MQQATEAPEDIEAFVAYANASLSLRSTPGHRHRYYPLHIVPVPRRSPRAFYLNGPPTRTQTRGPTLLRITIRDRSVYAGARSLQRLCGLHEAAAGALDLCPETGIDPRRRTRDTSCASRALTRADGTPLLRGDVLVCAVGVPPRVAFLQVDTVLHRSIRVHRLRKVVTPGGMAVPSVVYGPAGPPFRIRSDGRVPTLVARTVGCMASVYDPGTLYADNPLVA